MTANCLYSLAEMTLSFALPNDQAVPSRMSSVQKFSLPLCPAAVPRLAEVFAVKSVGYVTISVLVQNHFFLLFILCCGNLSYKINNSFDIKYCTEQCPSTKENTANKLCCRVHGVSFTFRQFTQTNASPDFSLSEHHSSYDQYVASSPFS